MLIIEIVKLQMIRKPNHIPVNPGIYIFKNASGKPLYIGKAAHIKKRLRSYFQKNISERVRLLREESASLAFEILPTEFDSLVREAELIKKYRPKFNVLMRDDKNYYYVSFSKEKFPRIIVTHQPERKHLRLIGPFTEGRPLFTILRFLRKSFPYCTCLKPHKRKCLNADIGRCLGFCCTIGAHSSPEEEKKYRDTVNAIRNVLSGKSRLLLRALKKDMEKASHEKRFEDAARLRDQFFDLQSILSHHFIIEDKNPFILRHAKTASYLQNLFRKETPVSRIEGYDISNISGKEATASLVIFIDGKPDKNEYRRFRVRFQGVSDFDMLKEVVARRMRHHEWPLPDSMLIDGGSPQLREVANVLAKFFKAKNPKTWPFVLVGLSKARRASGITRRKASGEEVLHIWPHKKMLLKHLPTDAMHLLQAVRDEAHRFARRYHHLLRKNALF